MKVIITETTQVASAIARALSVNNNVSAPGVFYDDKTAVITIEKGFITPYGVGILPGKDALPQVPGRYTYGLRMAADDKGRYAVAAEDQAYADYIGEIIRGGLEVTFASDGGADAQGRFANILRFFKVGAPTSRMWVKSLEKKALKKAYGCRVRGRSLHNLAQSGLVGMAMDEAFKYNVTEAYRALFPKIEEPICRQDVLVLALANNYLESDAQSRNSHESVTTHSVMASGEVLGHTMKFYPGTVFTAKEDCDKAYAALRLPETITTDIVEIDNEVMEAPALHILATLQCEAWEKLSFPFAKTRDIADRLFLEGLISSPRTYNAKLPAAMKDYILKRYKWAKGYPFGDDTEVPHTHGIITTGRKPFNLDADSQAVYDLIADRFEANLSGITMASELVIGVEINGETYLGTMPWTPGENKPETVEVKFTGKSQFTHKISVPMPPTKSDLFGAMSMLMRSLSDRYNPGMPFSSQHDLTDAFERLYANRLLLDVCGETAVTGEGKLLLETFDEYFALSNLMAYQVETERLYANRPASCGGAQLMKEYDRFIYDKTEQLITDIRLFPARAEENLCPICGRHSVIRYPHILKCHVCGFTMPRQFKGHKFTDKEIGQLLIHRYTSQIEFRNRRGHEFYDIVVIGKGKGLEFAPIAAKLY